MSTTGTIRGAVVATVLLAVLSIGVSQFGASLSSTAWAAPGGSKSVDVKIVSNNNRTFSIDVAALTVVDCSQGPVELVFQMVGSPRARFPDNAGAGIRVVNGAGVFDNPHHDGTRIIKVLDQCNTLGDFKYDVGIIDPNGVLVVLDPVIKNS